MYVPDMESLEVFFREDSTRKKTLLKIGPEMELAWIVK